MTDTFDVVLESVVQVKAHDARDLVFSDREDFCWVVADATAKEARAFDQPSAW